jgi:hypothetical protein
MIGIYRTTNGNEQSWPSRDGVDGVAYILLVMGVGPCTRHLKSLGDDGGKGQLRVDRMA